MHEELSGQALAGVERLRLDVDHCQEISDAAECRFGV
jgi:hypothetical protein